MAAIERGEMTAVGLPEVPGAALFPEVGLGIGGGGDGGGGGRDGRSAPALEQVVKDLPRIQVSCACCPQGYFMNTVRDLARGQLLGKLLAGVAKSCHRNCCITQVPSDEFKHLLGVVLCTLTYTHVYVHRSPRLLYPSTCGPLLTGAACPLSLRTCGTWRPGDAVQKDPNT